MELEQEMKKILLLMLLQIFLLANEKIDFTNPIFKDKAFQTLLEDEIRGGAYEGGDGGPIALYDLDPNYLKIEEPILSHILKVNGYQFPSKQEFKKKLKEMFNLESKARFFAFSTGESYKVYYGLNNHMAEDNWMNTIVFEQGFIVPYHRLPEWIDIDAVSKKFKNLNKSVKEPKDGDFEDWIPWRDEKIDYELNIKEFVTLNKYLFNNNKEKEVQSLGKSMVNNLVKGQRVHGDRVHINNKVYKSLWEFCNLTGMEEQKIRKLNPWINGDATNISANSEIVIRGRVLNIPRKE